MDSDARRMAARVAKGPAELGPLLNRQFVAYPHVVRMSETLSAAVLRPNSRTIVNLPPRHGKTWSITALIVWFLEKNPTARVVFSSNDDDLARATGKRVRDWITNNQDVLSISVPKSSSAADQWDLTTGGGLIAVGMKSSIVGWGADLLIVDDPHKDPAAARDKRTAQATYDHYRETLLTRLQRGGRVVLVGHRMAPGDLYGRVLEDDPGRWTVLSLPVVSTVDTPDGPQEVPLCADILPLAEIRQKEREVHPLTYVGEYLQEPRAQDGELFPADVHGWATVLPAAIPARPRWRVRAWDFAATLGGDWTVGTRMCSTSDGVVLVEDVVRFRGSPADVEKRIKATADADPAGTIVRIPKDPGSAGVAVADRYQKVLRGYTVIAEPVTGGKDDRAFPFSAAVLQGQARLVSRAEGVPAPWWEALVSEAATFPGGSHDDCVDSAADAFNFLQSKAKKGPGGYYDASATVKALAGRAGQTPRTTGHRTARATVLIPPLPDNWDDDGLPEEEEEAAIEAEVDRYMEELEARIAAQG